MKTIPLTFRHLAPGVAVLFIVTLGLAGNPTARATDPPTSQTQPNPGAQPDKPVQAPDEIDKLRQELAKAQLLILQQKRQLLISEASEKSYKIQNEALLKEKARVASALQKLGVKEDDPIGYVIDMLAEWTVAKAENEAREKRLKEMGETLREIDAKMKKAEEIIKGTDAVLKRSQDDYLKLRKALIEAQENSIKLINGKNEAERREAVTAIERNNALDRANQLEKENRQLAEDLLRLQPKGTKPAITTPPAKNPPTTRVEGKVTKVEEGLIKLNVGSDKGLKEGHTLEVFRLSDKPNQSRYLGTLRIIKVDPDASIGQMLSTPPDPVRVGDEVAPTTSVIR